MLNEVLMNSFVFSTPTLHFGSPLVTMSSSGVNDMVVGEGGNKQLATGDGRALGEVAGAIGGNATTKVEVHSQGNGDWLDEEDICIDLDKYRKRHPKTVRRQVPVNFSPAARRRCRFRTPTPFPRRVTSLEPQTCGSEGGAESLLDISGAALADPFRSPCPQRTNAPGRGSRDACI